MAHLAYLNGQFFPLDQARVSIDDRGFQFGDGVYEVVRVYQGKPFRLTDHLIRLERSAQAVRIPLTLGIQGWHRVVMEGIERSQIAESKVYIQVTRGVAPREHTFPASSLPTTLMTIRDTTSVEPTLRHEGVSVITLPDQRWGRCSIKSLNLLPNILAKQEAKERGAFEAILVKDGVITEGTSSNVMIVAQGELMTPALSDQLLAGVTRQELLALARRAGIAVKEQPVTSQEMMAAEEIFLAGTTIEVLGVKTVDGNMIGDGRVGPVTRRLYELLTEAIVRECSGSG